MDLWRAKPNRVTSWRVRATAARLTSAAIGFAISFGVCADEQPRFEATPSGLQYVITKRGTGPVPRTGSIVVFNYVGRLPDGTVFESTFENRAPAAHLIGDDPKSDLRVWHEGLTLLRQGDRATFLAPPALAYGARGYGKVPPNTQVKFDVEIIGVKSKTLSSVIDARIRSDGTESARKELLRLKEEGFTDVFESESQLNFLGYNYLYVANKAMDGLELLMWNAELYPSSVGAKTALAEAYLQNLDREKALANYRNAIKLNESEKSRKASIAPLVQRTFESLQARTPISTELAALQLRIGFLATYGNLEVDVPRLGEIVMASLAKSPQRESHESAELVKRFFKLAEKRESSKAQEPKNVSEDLPRLAPLYRKFTMVPNEEIRAIAEGKLKVIERLDAPIDLKFVSVDGQQIDTKQLRGKVVLIHFWNTFCGICTRDIPTLVSLVEKYRPHGLEVIGVSYEMSVDPAKPTPIQKSADQLLTFLKENNMNWPQFYDGKFFGNAIGSEYGINYLPAVFLLDRTGKIVSYEARASRLEAEVTRVLGIRSSSE